MTTEEKNLEIFRRLDSSFPEGGWKADWKDEFRRTHKEDVIVRQPGRRLEPITDIEEHIADLGKFGETFADLVIELPHRLLFASDDLTCAITRVRGSMTGPLDLPDGQTIPPTGKSFETELCTVARWDEGQMVEENLFYDIDSILQQVGIS